MKQAVRDMVGFLVKEKGLAPYDAYTLLSVAGDIRVSRTFRPISPVKMMLSVSNQRNWDPLRPERSGVRWRLGELPQGPVVTSASLDGLSLHLLPAS